MDGNKRKSKITPQLFIDRLRKDNANDIVEWEDRPPLSYVALPVIETRNRIISDQIWATPPACSLSLRSGYPLSFACQTIRSTSYNPDSIPRPTTNMSTPDPDRTSMLEGRRTILRARNMPLETSSTNEESQSQPSVSTTREIEARSHSQSIGVSQADLLAEFDQVFDPRSVESDGSRKRNPLIRSRSATSMAHRTGFGLKSVYDTPESQLKHHHQSQQSVPLSTLAYDVPLSGVRHDRDSSYAVRTRADGSTSLVKLPMHNLQRNDDSEFPSSTPTADNVPQEEESDDADNETKAEFKTRLIHLLKQMMFVSGETAEPSTETTWMIEEIVRDQVIEMLKEATGLANRRGSKSISIVDLIFQIRHNPAKVSRLKTFLSWKDVRKNVKDSDDKAGGGDADALDLDEGTLPGANPSAPQKTSTNKKAKLILPWEIQSYYSETVPEREDEEDEEEEEQNEATLARLASADERTKNMTREEYVYWSDCRQASFTFRKGKRFREWAGFGTVIDSKPNDDVVDILGFLTFEIVQTLTEEALKVKSAEDLANKKANGLRTDNESAKKRKREGCTLFEMPEEDRTPVEPKHVREAFRRLQLVPNKYKFMRQGYAGVRTPLRMI